MTTRRAFLKGVGAGLILPSAWDIFANYLETHDEPLMRVPKQVDHVLYATCWAEDFQLSLDIAEEEFPSSEMSIREFIDVYVDGDDPGFWDTKDYSEPIGDAFVWDVWPYQYSADAKAFYFLSNLHLGRLSDSTEVGEGYVDFIEGPCPGNNSRIVCVDGLGASLLQDRLIAYGHNVRVQLT